MSIISEDPRDQLVRQKYFSLRPKPLERWLWQQGLPQAAERVFWLHWEAGMRSGDWCSEIPIKHAARDCCVDPSTVTRAYQLLKFKGLIRREDPGRNPQNPFNQATAITEVRVPRELLIELCRSPNRAVKPGPEAPGSAASRAPIPAIPAPCESDRTPGANARVPLTRDESRALWGRASEGEKRRFFAASKDRIAAFEADVGSGLTTADRAEIVAQLQDQAAATPDVSRLTTRTPSKPEFAGPRRLTVLELARTRKRIGDCVPTGVAPEVLRQVIWAVEEGALRRFPTLMAVNIAIKKIREGAWSKPNRMPPNWVPTAAGSHAVPEQCSAA